MPKVTVQTLFDDLIDTRADLAVTLLYSSWELQPCPGPSKLAL